jgi:clan AA aspartic protease
MGLVYADIELVNFADETLCEDGYLSKMAIRKTKVQTLVDSGAIRLVINENVRRTLGLKIRDKMAVTLGDGTKRDINYAGPVKVIFKERFCITDAFVVPEDEEVLLGAVPMELMDLVIIPSVNLLDYNPAHPSGPVLSMRKIA